MLLDNTDSMQRRCGGVRTINQKAIGQYRSLLGGNQLKLSSVILINDHYYNNELIRLEAFN